MKQILIAIILPVLATLAAAHGGGVDSNGCHNTKAGARHCHGDNVGKYIPETEEKRLQKLHKSVCSGVDRPRFDFYGKKCR